MLLVCIDAGEGSEILTYGKTYEVEQNPIMTMTYDIIGDNNI